MDNFFIFFTLAAVVCAEAVDEKKLLWLYIGDLTRTAFH